MLRLLAFHGIRESRIFLHQRFQLIGGQFRHDASGIGDLIIDVGRDRRDATAFASIDFRIGASRFNFRGLGQGNFSSLPGEQDQLFDRERGPAFGFGQPYHHLHFVASSLLTQRFHAIKGSAHLPRQIRRIQAQVASFGLDAKVQLRFAQ